MSADVWALAGMLVFSYAAAFWLTGSLGGALYFCTAWIWMIPLMGVYLLVVWPLGFAMREWKNAPVPLALIMLPFALLGWALLMFVARPVVRVLDRVGLGWMVDQFYG